MVWEFETSQIANCVVLALKTRLFLAKSDKKNPKCMWMWIASCFLNNQTFYFVVSFWKERIASSQRLDLKRHFSLCSLFDLRRNPLMPASSLDENSIFWQQQRYICYQIPLRMNLLLAQAFHVYARFDWPRIDKKYLHPFC